MLHYIYNYLINVFNGLDRYQNNQPLNAYEDPKR